MSQKSIFADLPSQKIADWYVNDEVAPDKIADRVRRTEDWLEGARQVAEKTRDELAVTLLLGSSWNHKH